MGAVYGLIASTGITLARWATTAPYSLALVPWDVVLCALLVAFVFAASTLLTSRSHFGLRSPLVTVGIALLYGGVWTASLWNKGLSHTSVALCALIVVSAIGLIIFHSVRARLGPLPLAWFGLILGLGYFVTAVGYPHSKLFILVLPSVALLSLFMGVPHAPCRPTRKLVAPVVVSLVGLLVVCSVEYPFAKGRLRIETDGSVAEASNRPQNSVILVVLDALRRDHMSLYGYHRTTTPNLDRWARGGMVFDNATAASSWTLPSHASMFTGMYVRTHGAHGFISDEIGQNAYPLRESQTTLAELASEAGLMTAGIAANHAQFDPALGLDQGFATYWAERPRTFVRFLPSEWLAQRLDPWAYKTEVPYFAARHVTDNAIRWLREVGDRQFFLFLNYMDVHEPNWQPPNDAVPRKNDESFRGDEFNRTYSTVLQGEPLRDDLRAYLVDQYDRELHVLDADIERLLRHLAASGLSESTVVIVTSDHGEYYGEHTLLGHGKHLHGEVIRVPLIVRGPGIPVERTARPTHGTEVFPLVLACLGIEGGSESSESFTLSESHRPIVSEWYRSVIPGFLDPVFKGRFNRDLWTIKVGDLKLFVDSQGRLELYDTSTDPFETTDLALERPKDLDRMHSYFKQWLQTTPEARPLDAIRPDPAEMSQDQIEQLRALGYLE